MNTISKLMVKANNASLMSMPAPRKGAGAYYGALAGAGAVAASTNMVFAANAGLSDIFKKVEDALKDIYTEIIGIATVVAVTLIAACLMIRMFSKNPRSVEEATAWIKRICVTWVALMLLSYFVTFGKDLVSGGNTTNPWA